MRAPDLVIRHRAHPYRVEFFDHAPRRRVIRVASRVPKPASEVSRSSGFSTEWRSWPQQPGELLSVDWPRVAVAAWRDAGDGRALAVAASVVLDDAPLSLDSLVFNGWFFSNGSCLGNAAGRVRSGELDPVEAWWMTRFDYAWESWRAAYPSGPPDSSVKRLGALWSVRAAP